MIKMTTEEEPLFETLILNRERATEIATAINKNFPYAKAHGFSNLREVYQFAVERGIRRGVKLSDHPVSVIFGEDFIDDRIEIEPTNLQVLGDRGLQQEQCSEYALAHFIHRLIYSTSPSRISHLAPSICITYNPKESHIKRQIDSTIEDSDGIKDFKRIAEAVASTMEDSGIRMPHEQIIGIYADNETLVEKLPKVLRDEFERFLLNLTRTGGVFPRQQVARRCSVYNRTLITFLDGMIPHLHPKIKDEISRLPHYQKLEGGLKNKI